MQRSRIPSPRALLRIGIVLTMVSAAGAAWSHANGITGYSGKQGSICNSCHQGGPSPAVKLEGPAALDAGVTATYTFTIESDAAVVTGLNAAVTDGVMAVTDTDRTRLEDNEITHVHPITPDGGVTVFTFSLTAPEFGGPVTLFAAGNATNGNDDTDGDQAKSTQLQITVNGPPKPPDVVPNDGGTSLLPSDPAKTTDDAGTSNSRARPTSDSSDSGCGVGRPSRSSLPSGAVLAFALAAIVRGRRRRP